jgi:hypothetical protein
MRKKRRKAVPCVRLAVGCSAMGFNVALTQAGRQTGRQRICDTVVGGKRLVVYHFSHRLVGLAFGQAGRWGYICHSAHSSRLPSWFSWGGKAGFRSLLK